MKQLYTMIALAAGAMLSAQHAEAQVSNVSDLYGEYNAVYVWGFDSERPDFLITPTISAGEAENEVLITNLFPTEGEDYGLDASTPIVGTVDLTNMTLNIAANQDLGTDSFGANSLYIAQFNPQTGNFIDATSVTATITENNNIVFPTDYVVGCATTAEEGGYWYVFFDLFLQPYSGKYEVNPQDLYGEYLLGCYWDAADANGEPIDLPADDNFNVVIAQSDSDNPYPGEIEINNLYPYLGDFSIEAQVLPSGEIMIEGYQQFTVPNIIYQLEILDYASVSYLDFVVGTIDEDGTIVFPEDLTLAMTAYDSKTQAFIGYYGYYNLILQPADEDLNGVEAIEFDDNAPVKYFNLKGMEVKNPQKGEVLIKSQGSKKAKVLVK